MIASDAYCHECARPIRKLQAVPGPGEQPRTPEPGDPVLCGHCGALGYLEPSGYTVRPSDTDIKHWSSSQPDSWRMLREIRAEIMNR
jgi:hypothetical protein